MTALTSKPAPDMAEIERQLAAYVEAIHEDLLTAITTALTQRDARIAELEELLRRATRHDWQPSPGEFGNHRCKLCGCYTDYDGKSFNYGCLPKRDNRPLSAEISNAIARSVLANTSAEAKS